MEDPVVEESDATADACRARDASTPAGVPLMIIASDDHRIVILPFSGRSGACVLATTRHGSAMVILLPAPTVAALNLDWITMA